MPFEIGLEHALTVGAALLISHAVEPRAAPCRQVAFDDEGAHCCAVAVMVRYKRAVRVLAEGQRQAVEELRRTVPGEPVGEPLDLRLELGFERTAHERVRSVGSHQQIATFHIPQRSKDASVLDAHAGVAAEILQKLIELQAPDGRESVAVDIHPFVTVNDPLHRPALQANCEFLVKIRHVALEKRERALREHHAETESSIRRVLFEYFNPPVRKSALD